MRSLAVISLIAGAIPSALASCFNVTSWWPTKECGQTSDESICGRGWNVYPTNNECRCGEFQECGDVVQPPNTPPPVVPAPSTQPPVVNPPPSGGSCSVVKTHWPQECHTISDALICGRGWGVFATDADCMCKEFSLCGGQTPPPVGPPQTTPPPVVGPPQTTPPPIVGPPQTTPPPVVPPPQTTPPTQVTTRPAGPVTTRAPVTQPPAGSGVPEGLIDLLHQTKWEDILVVNHGSKGAPVWKPSKIYFSEDLIAAVVDMAVKGVADMKLWLGTEAEGADAYKYGAVAIAAFLAQSMKETIEYDACDENNWDMTSGYTAANACGQLGQSYQDYDPPKGLEHTTCSTDPNKFVVATTNAFWYGAPGPLFAGPKSMIPGAPKWDHSSPWCDPNAGNARIADDKEYIEAVMNGTGDCKMYDGQKAGKWIQCPGGCPNDEAPKFEQPARTDVEGCYWWGRGVIQTTGIANFGLLNYFSGAQAHAEGRDALFPDVDFCRNPEEICKTTKYPEMKWFSGLFYWVNNVQKTDQDGWNYYDELKEFVTSGWTSTRFVDGCSGVVNRGCPFGNCGTGPIHDVDLRQGNFFKVLKAMNLP